MKIQLTFPQLLANRALLPTAPRHRDQHQVLRIPAPHPTIRDESVILQRRERRRNHPPPQPNTHGPRNLLQVEYDYRLGRARVAFGAGVSTDMADVALGSQWVNGIHDEV